jgi:hypothetical protein
MRGALSTSVYVFSWSSDKMLSFWTRMNDLEERWGAALPSFLKRLESWATYLRIFEMYKTLTRLCMLKRFWTFEYTEVE